MSLFPAFDESPPQAARLRPKLRALAERGIYFGTNSWKYEGWLGSIYSADRYQTRGKFSRTKFDAECLAEYAETFPAVCGDFAFYGFPTGQYWAELFGSTPKGFLFGLKVPEDITVATWPRLGRYGKRAGEPNENFLDGRTFERLFAGPLEPYRGRLGPLIFEFETFNRSTFGNVGDFMARLDPFLKSLPQGFRYAVELRNPEYLIPDYLGLLASHNVAHVFSAWTRMPELQDQVQLSEAFTADVTVVRAMLARGRTYEQAVMSFEPYDRIQDQNESARQGMVEIAGQAREGNLPAYIFVNNRLEGNAPSTIEAVVDGVGGAG